MKNKRLKQMIKLLNQLASDYALQDGKEHQDLSTCLLVIRKRFEELVKLNQLIEKTEQWFINRNLDSLDGMGQLTKLKEEVDELVDARLSDDKPEEIDAVGDITVVLIGYCMQRGLNFMDCLDAAYEEIKDRKGKVINGVFVKEAK
ncbi:MazG-like family protein [Vaginisenegalia massiliensis]|uniref:MazG-like family protein n=1 Tax=Vaginisenegalia massiliensis TaxID=2058294 RepID=UPI001F14C369|nr:MazG-like family protein [Vaginisenegalia massiliensis]